MFHRFLASLIIVTSPFTLHQLSPGQTSAPVQRSKPPVVVEQSISDAAPAINIWSAGNKATATEIFNEVVLVNTLVANQQKAAAEAAARLVSSPPHVSPIVVSASIVATSSNIAAVMQCIKNHESGNYAENSHAGGASGAYQYEPGTWQTWSARAGYPGYMYAYEAPPNVQDAVTAYTLTHGGAGNWSPRFGPDPCTVGIGG